MPDYKAEDAIALLKADHRKVEGLFAQFEKASGDGRKQKLALQICHLTPGGARTTSPG